ncbi:MULTISPECIES: hypothetical protein [unclassified Bacillus (in: firmicutes)]|uniref:hypothetical protein n=1 Tax=unclassified Bacillus (in: firmicutes) TaxID=185979 RepID=UPI0008EC79AA|nr:MULTISPECIES: hypothetical protein [unclassified Bacillus (in: firmicutes)]SFB25723.1 hypothetical protein SAMN02799634_11515 [Bacillus sp. UNCCL13]SFQ91814.1 hypothetical protein SAMN04488577_0179 [Bacillus sp. cl95]
MFDPTAFDNMKVVLEGTIYDLDIDGVINVIDRNDLMNLAKMSREFDVSFEMAGEKQFPIVAKFHLKAKLENLASELLLEAKNSSIAGCHLELSFSFMHKNEQVYFERINDLFLSIWGENRSILQTATFNPFKKNDYINNKVKVGFHRVIEESQLDDLTEVVPYMLDTIKKINYVLQDTH